MTVNYYVIKHIHTVVIYMMGHVETSPFVVEAKKDSDRFNLSRSDYVRTDSANYACIPSAQCHHCISFVIVTSSDASDVE